MGMLVDSQHTMVEAVLHAIQHSLHFSVLFNASGGIFVQFALDSSVCVQGQIALAVANSGKQWQHVILLTGGCTFHSRFKASLQPDTMSIYSITNQSSLAYIYHQSKLIIQNEARMAYRHLL